MRHAVITLREEARRLFEALGEIVTDDSLDILVKLALLRQTNADLLDVHAALVELGGQEALDTILNDA